MGVTAVASTNVTTLMNWLRCCRKEILQVTDGIDLTGNLSSPQGMPMQIETLAVGFLLMTVFESQASAQERALKRSELPAAVQRAADEQSRGATVHGYATEKEDGRRVYEVEMTLHGRGRDVTLDSAGTVLEIEAEVAFDSLPEAVRVGLQHAAGSGQITKVESLTKRGALVAYEAHVHSGTKRSEVQVGPEGKPLAHPE